jgi:uncharacterized membrane protein
MKKAGATRPFFMLNRLSRAWLALTPARRVVVAVILLAAATLPVLSRLALGRTAGDISVFRNGVEALLQGFVYRDGAFEYPPYALAWFVVPHALSHDLESFRFAFGLEMWLVDAVIKALLLWRGMRARAGLGDLAPFLAYSVGGFALGHVILQRYDLVPAALTLGAALAVAGGGAFLGGVLVAVGVGTKLYPALLVPMLAVFAWRSDRRRGLVRFVSGMAIAAVPALLAAFWMPWWRFASYHLARGLQAESPLASIVWALHFFGVTAGWELVWRAVEVTGPLASRLAGPGRVLWVAATLACLASATLAAWRMAQTSRHVSMAEMAAVLLLPIAAFVSTNVVLSPQFHLWLLPLAALVLVPPPVGPPGARRAAWCIVFATVIVPVFFPHREYAAGLGLFRTAVLLLRNGVLIYATISLWLAVRKMGKPHHEGHEGHEGHEVSRAA